MDGLYIFLTICLAFAALVLILLAGSYIYKECRGSSEKWQRPPYFEGEEMRLQSIDQLNQPIPSAPSNTYTRLTPRGAAAILTDVQNGNTYPNGDNNMNIYTNLPRHNPKSSVESVHESRDELRVTQACLLNGGEQAVIVDSTVCNLLIGVYADNQLFCGYCVNLVEKWVEFYRIHRDDMPWNLAECPDNSEFEMGNLFFALMLWNDRIEDAKNFHIYTGSPAVNHDNNKLWRRATKLLEHLSACQRIIVGNDCRFYVNPNKDIPSFALKILPAKDLSQDSFSDFQGFISQYYEVPLENFNGTHFIPTLEEQKAGRTNMITDNYQLYIDKVKETRKKYKEPCTKCTYIDDHDEAVYNVDSSISIVS